MMTRTATLLDDQGKPTEYFAKIAHVSGNQIDVLHCPFCGSGAIVARSDGSINCSFCNAAFTVTVSPVFPAFPQSVGGDAYPWPGRPDGGVDPSQMQMDPDQPGGGFGGSLIPGGDDEGEDGEDDGGNPFASDDDGGEGEDDEEDGGDDEGTQAEVGGKKKPPFGKKSAYEPPWVPNPDQMSQLDMTLGRIASYRRIYHTAFGGVVMRDEFMRHLAIATAKNPAEAAAHIRAQRALAAQLEAERR